MPNLPTPLSTVCLSGSSEFEPRPQHFTEAVDRTVETGGIRQDRLHLVLSSGLRDPDRGLQVHCIHPHPLVPHSHDRAGGGSPLVPEAELQPLDLTYLAEAKEAWQKLRKKLVDP